MNCYASGIGALQYSAYTSETSYDTVYGSYIKNRLIRMSVFSIAELIFRSICHCSEFMF